MSQLLLVKHALPEIVSDVPSNQWHLSEPGRARCNALADKLAAYNPNVIVSSVEPKAAETARIVAYRLDKPFEMIQGLHEHERSSVGFLGAAQFEAAAVRFFEKQHELVLGSETAGEAHERFARAVAGVVEKYRKSVAIVSHGTVISLFVARAAKLEPFAFWKRLGLPSFVVMSLPDFRLEQVIEKIE